MTPNTMATGRGIETTYQRMVQTVRLSRSNLGMALHLQRRGRTLSEIADALKVPLLSVQNSLYWDLM